MGHGRPFVFLTYLHDHPQIDYCPYLLFYAVPERGKSRTGKSVAYVAFRGIHLIELREANIFRYSQHLHGTLFFDLMDVSKKAERSGCDDILLLRAEKGAKCCRVIHPELGAFPRYGILRHLRADDHRQQRAAAQDPRYPLPADHHAEPSRGL